MGSVGSLTPEQVQLFNSQGYLVLESFSCPEEIDGLRKRMDELLDGFDCSTASIFSSKNQKQLTDNYFYESAEKISFFFEEKAFDDDGNLKQSKQLSINKVGHALHELDPVFKKFSSSAKISSLLSSLGYKRPVVIQSMYIFKLTNKNILIAVEGLLPIEESDGNGECTNVTQRENGRKMLGDSEKSHPASQPGIGGEVVPHQDNSFLYTEPRSCTGLWLALEDATIVNGCLWALPGSHKNGLVRRFIRDEEGVHFDHPSPSYDHKDFVALEVKAGSLVVIHGDLIHQSFENKSAKSRHAYSLHVVDTDGCKWAPDNWIRRNVGPEPLYVS